MPANVGQMFYYGEIPWHGEGVELDHPANADEVLVHGGLNWDVEMISLQTAESPASPVSRRRAVVRKDRASGHRGRVLGVAHPGFCPLQNRDAINMLDRLLEGRAIYHTGGYLGDGEVIWVLAKISEDMKISQTDIIEPYLLFTNSHDGSIAVDIRLTTVRVVCQNTLTKAFHKEFSGKIMKHRHNGRWVEMEKKAKAFYSEWLQLTKDCETEFKQLAALPCSEEKFNVLLSTLLPLPKPPPVDANRWAKQFYQSRKSRVEAARNQVWSIYHEGFDLSEDNSVPAEAKTFWGALNTFTAFVDHVQEIKGDQFSYSMFGQGAKFKNQAYDLIRKQVLPAT